MLHANMNISKVDHYQLSCDQLKYFVLLTLGVNTLAFHIALFVSNIQLFDICNTIDTELSQNYVITP